ncbi:hypothetical protein JSY14_09470 [Brachybacterium sp. EF45031]|nr:hypothetical protein [Brachybacterium sillae]MCS6712234.1 hypothetical protein [Brachybacterium sillae]
MNSGRVDLEPYICAKIQPDEVVEKGFGILTDRGNSAVKILVAPQR